MKKFYVYKITNINNNKIYIGKANNPRQKFFGYIKESKKDKNSLLHSSIKKEGKENFILEIIKECQSEKIAEKYNLKYSYL